MIALPNPFTDSAAPNPAAAQAVAPLSMPPGAAADLSSMEKGGTTEAPAETQNPVPAGATDRLGCRIDDVGQIFHFARMLCAEARIHPGTISPAAVAVAEEIKAYEDVYYDPPPLFLRYAGFRR